MGVRGTTSSTSVADAAITTAKINDGAVTPIKRAYDDLTAIPAVGTVIAAGDLVARVFNSGATGLYSVLPGHIGPSATKTAPAARVLFVLGIPASGSQTDEGILPRGVKVYVRGIIKSPAGTRIDSTHYKIAVGVSAGGSNSTQYTSFGNATEATADDFDSIYAIVDNSNNISAVNCAIGGDATPVDSTFDALLTADTVFEVIVECPSTGAAFNSLLVTIKMGDSGGTLRTIFSGATPTGTGTAEHAGIFLLLNVVARVYALRYKVEVAT